MRLPLAPDPRDPGARARAIDQAREGDAARRLLDAALEALEDPVEEAQWIARERAEGNRVAPSAQFWEALDAAYVAIDAYLEHLLTAAEIQVTCGPSCSACCADAPPTFSVEGLRVVRALRDVPGSRPRFQLAVDHARDFQRRLLVRTGQTRGIDVASPEYRQTQLEWRALGKPCPALGDDGDCLVYEQRPLACRRHFSVEDPAHCEPRSPRFFAAEHPPVWTHPREAEFERTLAHIGELLALPPTPNLPWAIATFHAHGSASR